MNTEEKVEKLKKETIALRKEMIIMKTLVKQQNELIKSLLEKAHKAEMYAKPVTKTRDWFPIQSQEALDEFETSVDETNQNEIIYEARRWIKNEGLMKSIGKILDNELLFNYNLEGNYNKRRLFDYQNLLDILFKATHPDGIDHAKFISQLRRGIRLVKRKHHNKKYNSLEAKKIKSNDSENDEQDEEEEDEFDDE